MTKDIRPGVPFEPTYIYKLLTLTKSSLSEKVRGLSSDTWWACGYNTVNSLFSQSQIPDVTLCEVVWSKQCGEAEVHWVSFFPNRVVRRMLRSIWASR